MSQTADVRTGTWLAVAVAVIVILGIIVLPLDPENTPEMFLLFCLGVQEGQENVEILPSGERPQANQKRITTPYMTKYERARVLGTRALQIA